MSEINQETVRDLDCTKRWREFYKDKAQALKDSKPTMDDKGRTGKLVAIAGEAVEIRGTQLKDAWLTRFFQYGTSLASKYSALPPNSISNAAVILFTLRALKCLGLDKCRNRDTIYREARSIGGVQERTRRQKFREFLDRLLTRFEAEACLEGIKTCLEEFFEQLEVERASDIADGITRVYGTSRDIIEMEQTYDDVKDKTGRVLEHLKMKARECHTTHLIPAVVLKTQ